MLRHKTNLKSAINEGMKGFEAHLTVRGVSGVLYTTVLITFLLFMELLW